VCVGLVCCVCHVNHAVVVCGGGKARVACARGSTRQRSHVMYIFYFEIGCGLSDIAESFELQPATQYLHSYYSEWGVLVPMSLDIPPFPQFM